MSIKEKHAYRSWVEVDLDAYTSNCKEVKRLAGPGVRILHAVKADAYGHGAIETSNVALKNGVYALGVANADEGVQLRVSGITAPIIILSPSPVSEIQDIIKYSLTPSVSDLAFAREMQKASKKAEIRGPIHIEVDTGMGRGGTMHTEAMPMIEEILALPNLVIEGIFSHFACSEVLIDYNLMQWHLFKEILDTLAERNIPIPLRHMANSGALLNYPESRLDMVRPGLMTYGIHPSGETWPKANLEPVMTFKTRVVLLKEFPEGYRIGYGGTYTTDKPRRIATIPVGYGDGYGVILSNQGEVLIRGKRAPIVGRVSMDMCTIDATGVEGCQVGDEVVILGRQGSETISADQIAGKAKTIAYEILCDLGKRAPRIFIHRGKADAIEPRLRRIFIPGEEKSAVRLDSIMRHSLQARARNEELGDAIYYEIFETLFGKEDRQLELREDFRYDITVSEFMEEIPPVKDLKVTTHIEYTKTFRDAVFMIGCALNNKQLEAFFEDKRCEYRWLLNDGGEAITERDFIVGQVRIDGQDVQILRTEHTDRGLEVWCGGEELRSKVNKKVKLEIEITTRKSKTNNLFSVYLVYPTRGLDITFNYANAAIRNVREVSFFAGKHPYPEVTREPGKRTHVRISEDEWIFPTSGVTFIWDS